MTAEEQRLVASLVEQIDMLMPEIEKAIDRMWKRGDYFNAPRFGATFEAVRAASAGEAGTATTVQQGVVHEHATAAGGDAQKGSA